MESLQKDREEALAAHELAHARMAEQTKGITLNSKREIKCGSKQRT
jgi:hypothetical protein